MWCVTTAGIAGNPSNDTHIAMVWCGNMDAYTMDIIGYRSVM